MESVTIHEADDSKITTKKTNARKFWNCFKCTFFVVCVGGFSYQITQFLLQFYSYPTVVMTDIWRPDTFIEPSYSFCYRNPVRRSEYCKAYPENCEQPQRLEVFCDKKPHYCEGKNISQFLVPKPEFYMDPDIFTQQDLDDFGQDQLLVNASWEEDYEKPLFLEQWYWLSETTLHPCRGFHVRLFGKQEPNHRKFLAPQIRVATVIQQFQMTIEEDELFDPRNTPELIFAVQSPYETKDPYTDGVALKPGKAYEIHVRLEEEHLLPSPYGTACIDYEETWKKNNKTGPRSSSGCLDICLDLFTMPCYNCTVTIPTKRYDICKGRVDSSCSREESAEKEVAYFNCMKQCRIECRTLMYKFKAQEVPDKHSMVDSLGRKLISIDVMIDEPEIRAYLHKPKYHEVELFSYIGGFLGCWLGISIWSSAYNLIRVKTSIKVGAKKAIEKMNSSRRFARPSMKE